MEGGRSLLKADVSFLPVKAGINLPGYCLATHLDGLPDLVEGLLRVSLVPFGCGPVYRQCTAKGLQLLCVGGGLVGQPLLQLEGGISQLRGGGGGRVRIWREDRAIGCKGLSFLWAKHYRLASQSPRKPPQPYSPSSAPSPLILACPPT